MYVIVCNKSNIAHVIGTVSHFLSNPSKEHWNVVKWIEISQRYNQFESYI